MVRECTTELINGAICAHTTGQSQETSLLRAQGPSATDTIGESTSPKGRINNHGIATNETLLKDRQLRFGVPIVQALLVERGYYSENSSRKSHASVQPLGMELPGITFNFQQVIVPLTIQILRSPQYHIRRRSSLVCNFYPAWYESLVELSGPTLPFYC